MRGGELSRTDIMETKQQPVENFRRIKPEKEMTVKELNEAVKYEWNKAAQEAKAQESSGAFKETGALKSDGTHREVLPKSDGVWEGERGDSLWISDADKIPEKSNPDGKTFGEILKSYNMEGIKFNKGEPDFSEVSKGEAHIAEFTDNRDKNFKQADEYIAEKRGCSPEEVKEWRKKNDYTWHERRDCETMDKVPSIIHNNVPHSGGISEKKREINMEEWLRNE